MSSADLELPIGFSDSDFARVRDVVRYVEGSYPPSGNGRFRLPPPTSDGIPIYNASGSTLNKYTLVRPTAVRLVGKRIFIDVVQPDTTFSQDILIVGEDDIPNARFGRAQRGPIVRFAYDTGSPALGDGYGPKPSQGPASRNYPCCLTVEGIYDGGNKIALGRWKPIDRFIGKANASIAESATTGVVKVCQGAGGSETAITGMTLSGVSNPFEPALATDDLLFIEFAEGVPYIVRAKATRMARFLEFTLPSALTTSDASKANCTVVANWEGTNPGSTVTVYNYADVAGGYQWAGPIGAHGYAQWDDVLGRYRIYDLNCNS